MRKECCICGMVNDSMEKITVQSGERYYCSVECLVKPRE